LFNIVTHSRNMGPKVEYSSYHVTGFHHRSAEYLGREITKYLQENPSLDLIDIKYSSYGFENKSNTDDVYSALVICQEK
ncbi:MAG: hypothetical protein QOC37_11760, partial [Nitrososphaeraceae archaeon]|nr:hypothetical protein [Nitrososphaeraceae archaeon]